MTFKSALKLESPIFSAEKRRAAGGRACVKTARMHKDSIRKKMVFGKPSGRSYLRERGVGFGRRFHRASAPGERPAVYTGNLANRAVKQKRTGETSAVTFVDTSVAPYAEDLINIQRVIISAEDRQEAQRDLNRNVANEFRNLFK